MPVDTGFDGSRTEQGTSAESMAQKRTEQRADLLSRLDDKQREVLVKAASSPVHLRKDEMIELVVNLERRGPGGTYQTLFEYALTTSGVTQEDQARNAFSLIAEVNKDHELTLSSMDDATRFTDKIRPDHISREAKVLASMVHPGLPLKGEHLLGIEDFVDGLHSRVDYDKIVDFPGKSAREYMAEACLALLATGNLRTDYAREVLSYLGRDAYLGENASFWKHVDASWVEPLKNENPRRATRENTTFRDGFVDAQEPQSRTKEELPTDVAELQERLRRSEELITELRGSNNRLANDLGEAVKETTRLEHALGDARAMNEQLQREKTDPVTTFLLNNGLSLERLEEMDKGERKKVIMKLKVAATKAYHPDAGIAPNAEFLKQLFPVLDEYEGFD